MENLTANFPEILILGFIAITFLQSGIDKITDWKGNISWLTGHFAKTFLKNYVGLMVAIVLIAEVLTGIWAVGGIIFLLTTNDPLVGLYAAVLAGITLLMLLFGQRVAKDYAGAFTITGYFMVVVFGVYLLST